jgi:cobalt-zinc-cadmium efflux system membrane fusion protein
MTRLQTPQCVLLGFLLLVGAIGTGCSAQATDTGDGAPPPVVVDHDGDSGLVRVEHPEQFPLATVTGHVSAPELSVTGVVNADVSRAVPVVSLASGRVVDLRVRLGDRVQKGQLLLRIQSPDVSTAVAEYRKAAVDRALAASQLDRANALFERGAIARKDLDLAQAVMARASADAENVVERLRVLGIDPQGEASSIIDILAPVTGVITEQNVTNAGGVKSLDNSPNLFTVSDLSHLWIVCDVYENDLATVHIGDTATIQLTAYPDRTLAGRVGNIGAILDPAIRTVKVRIEVENPGLLRIGMFVTATFRGPSTKERAVVPNSAILHLHDRDWVYVPVQFGRFRRVAVTSGQVLPDQTQEILSGLQPGQRVVSNALVLQNTVEQ